MSIQHKNLVSQLVLFSLLVPLATSCLAQDKPRSVEAGVSLASMYLFRGVPQTDAGVLQANLDMSAPTKMDGVTAGLSVWGNMDLTDNQGTGIFPHGNAGKFTEIDVIPSVSFEVGETAVDIGITNYNFPTGNNNFPAAVGTTTSEVFASLGWNVAGLDTGVTLNYDFDELDDYYASGSVGKSFEISDTLSVDTSAGLGIAGTDQSALYFGTSGTGLSDANVRIAFNFICPDSGTWSVGAMYTSVVNSKYEAALDALGISTNNVVVWLGVSL